MQFTKSLASLFAFVVVAAAITDRATVYAPEGEVGACGKIIQNSDLFVALSSDNYANGAHCGELFVVEHGTKGVAVEVGDICFACTGY
ncbi:hypothetical protein B0H13DRAFT_2330732 [Mycena leptocephala]|nr:hypothetical protein B0H13DRAFT_2330732 [Mycena leptocephala]